MSRFLFNRAPPPFSCFFFVDFFSGRRRKKKRTSSAFDFFPSSIFFQLFCCCCCWCCLHFLSLSLSLGPAVGAIAPSTSTAERNFFIRFPRRWKKKKKKEKSIDWKWMARPSPTTSPRLSATFNSLNLSRCRTNFSCLRFS